MAKWTMHHAINKQGQGDTFIIDRYARGVEGESWPVTQFIQRVPGEVWAIGARIARVM